VANNYNTHEISMQPASADITALLSAWAKGDAAAFDRLTPLVYPHLRRLARHYLRRERAADTLESGALVHEVYLRLVGAGAVDWQNRAHFFAVSARIMRRILVDAARARASQKRGAGHQRVDHATAVDLDALPDVASVRALEMCALDDALQAFAKIDARRAQVVELRFFGGLSVDEVAATLQVSPQTVMRDWRIARAWLARQLCR
jgi:RNA polymerase sigma-70 factor, ECF subfamily